MHCSDRWVVAIPGWNFFWMQFWAMATMRVTQKKAFVCAFYGSSLTIHRRTIKINYRVGKEHIAKCLPINFSSLASQTLETEESLKTKKPKKVRLVYSKSVHEKPPQELTLHWLISLLQTAAAQESTPGEHQEYLLGSREEHAVNINFTAGSVELLHRRAFAVSEVPRST